MNLLIIDDEINILKTTEFALRAMGHSVFTARTSRQAKRILTEDPIHAIFLDMMLGSENGLDFLDNLTQEMDNAPPVIVFTAHSSIESAIDSMKRGAYDYIQKPFIPEEIRQMLNRLEKELNTSAKLKDLEKEVKGSNPEINMDTSEPEVKKAYSVATKAASSDASILILGPSGTGKSVLAKTVHDHSERSDKRFVTVNCPSLSKELLESELFGHVKGSFTGATNDTWGKVSAASGGTLFLDEIGELPLEIQPKLLRLLQDREFERVGDPKTHKADVRVVAATNRDLKKDVEEGYFREDLYYRLNVITVAMPPLTERSADILTFANSFLTFFSKRMGRDLLKLSEEAKEALVDYGWPGNVRELKNVIERAVILSDKDVLAPSDLPLEIDSDNKGLIRPGSMITLDELESVHLKKIIAKSDSLESAAHILGIDPATLYRKRKKLELC